MTDTDIDNQASYISECFGIPLEKAREVMKALAAKKTRKKR
ncbi:MAG: hypothetical protein Q7T81_09105 [Pseudolabrys sp.]|nr:hypothetical protein [Pseudolabrys sp.]